MTRLPSQSMLWRLALLAALLMVLASLAVVGDFRMTHAQDLVTAEPTDADFPGSPSNGATTNGVVRVGTTSTGNLTAGLDTSSGLTGDYWRLEVTPGRSYRLEMSIAGTDGSLDRGGSIGIEFTEAGSDELVGYGSVDDFRNDGDAFTHFTVTETQGGRDHTSRRYFVRVAAWDGRPEGNDPLIYNGPYQLTLTDITGVELVVENTYGGATETITESENLSRRFGTQIGRRFGVTVTTGSHPQGYIIDRIEILVLGDGPDAKDVFVEVYGGTAFPGHATDPICKARGVTNFAGPTGFQVDTVYRVTQLAPNCATNTLSASTTYYLVFHTFFADSAHQLSLTNSDTQYTYGSGWSIGDTARVHAGALTSSWSTVSDSRVPRFKVWAKEVGAGGN